MIPIHDDNPTKSVPFVTVALIAVCIAVFLWQLSLGSGFAAGVYQFGAIPAAILGLKMRPDVIAVIPLWATLFTSMFMHAGWLHLLGNMLYLWIFGNNIEDSMGHFKFIVFYIVCGLIAALSHIIPNAGSTIPMVGASGAISGILGAYLLLFPRAMVLVVIPIIIYPYTIRVPAILVLGVWFLLQILSKSNTEGGVAFAAHIGGFVAGMLLVPIFKKRSVKFFN